MIWGVDCRPPTDNQLRLMKADGVQLCALYHGSPGDGIDPKHLASDADFDRVRRAGLATFAYVSGNENPLGIRAWSERVKVSACVDVERFIRSDGAWVQPWLDLSGTGLYGNLGVFKARRAAFYVLALYPGGMVTKSSWVPGGYRPPGPCAWQYQGTTDAYSMQVDRLWLDDIFGAGVAGLVTKEDDPLAALSDAQQQALYHTTQQVYYLLTTNKDSYTDVNGIWHPGTRSLFTVPGGGSGLDATQAQQLAETHAKVVKDLA